MMVRRDDIYGGKSPLELPAYTPTDAAHYLRLPASTVRAWLFGRGYPTQDGTGRFRPLIQIADRTSRLLSFHNMVELHVLRGLRAHHGVKLPEVRTALAYIRKHFGTERPLLDEPLLTEGTYVLVERYGSLINASKEGQEEMEVAVRQHLARVKRDDHGVPIRLFPFETTNEALDRRRIFIDPRVRFGRPCISGGIPTSVILERFAAGDEIDDLAQDFGRDAAEIEAAIRYEQAA